MNKKGMILFLTIILALSITAVGKAADFKVRVIVDDAEIRLKPDLRSQVIKRVPLATVLKAEEKVGEWYFVSLPADERGFVTSGYIHQSFVEEVGEAIPEVPKVKEVPPVEEPRVEEEPPPPPPPPAPQVYVPEEVGIGAKSSIGIKAGYSMLSEEKYGGGLLYGANFSFGFHPNIAIELSGASFQSNVTGDINGLSEGKISAMPIQLSLQARIPVGSQLVAYVLGGVGYYLNDFKVDDAILNTWGGLGFDIEEKVDNCMGFHFGAGVDYFIARNIAVNADFRYCIAKAKGTWTITDQIGGTSTTGNLEDLNLGGMMIGAGLKFCF